MLFKRSFDFVSCAVGLLVLSPFLVVISILIKLDSPGPVFYRGVRIGLNGKPFRIYKFRSMQVDADQIGGTATAYKDPRITRIGGFLRKYKIDEFPQLINVLKGDMSIVGPRPDVEEHTSCYTEEEKIVLTVLPGITDYSSIRFIKLNELIGSKDPNKVFIEKYRDEKNRLRMEYVKNQSFWNDIKIILKTLLSILRIGRK